MAKHKLGTVLREWQEVEPDVRPQPLSELGLDCGSLLKVLGNWMGGIRFYITPACLEAVCLHVGSSTLEVGGLLLGRAFEVDSEGDPVVLIEQIGRAHV